MIACHLDALEPFWLKCARSEATVMQLVHDQFSPPPPEPARTWNAYDEMVKWEAETGYTGDNLYLDWVKSWLLPEQVHKGQFCGAVETFEFGHMLFLRNAAGHYRMEIGLRL